MAPRAVGPALDLAERGVDRLVAVVEELEVPGRFVVAPDEHIGEPAIGARRGTVGRDEGPRRQDDRGDARQRVGGIIDLAQSAVTQSVLRVLVLAESRQRLAAPGRATERAAIFGGVADRLFPPPRWL